MHTLGFDSTLTSSTHDPFGNAVDPANNGFGFPVRIPGGASRNIILTVKPTAAVGTDVQGLLNVVTVPSLPTGANSLPEFSTGEVVATVPYEYTIN
jgi:hypothetical protein